MHHVCAHENVCVWVNVCVYAYVMCLCVHMYVVYM